MNIQESKVDTPFLTDLWRGQADLSSCHPHERPLAMQRPSFVWVLVTVVFIVLLANSFWTSQQLSVLLGRQPFKYPQVSFNAFPSCKCHHTRFPKPESVLCERERQLHAVTSLLFVAGGSRCQVGSGIFVFTRPQLRFR